MDWLKPWWPVAGRPDLAAAHEEELQAELGPEHPLYGWPLATVGKRAGSDDVLFQVLDGSGRVAEVHLTWARHPEPPPWPACEVFASLDEWVEQRMRPDHAEFTADRSE